MAFLCQPLTLSSSQGVHRLSVEFQIDPRIVLSSPISSHSVPPQFRRPLNGFQTLVRLSDLAVCFARPTASLVISARLWAVGPYSGGPRVNSARSVSECGGR